MKRLVLILFFSGLFNPLLSVRTDQENESYYLEVFKQAFKMLRYQYVDKDKVKSDTLIYGAIKGMISTLEDPHTSLFKGKNLEKFINKIHGHFIGIGVYISSHKNGIMVVNTIKGGPAWEIGIKANDVIIEVDGVYINGFSLYEAKKIILGEPGSVVKVTILRGKKKKNYNVVRRSVKVQTVFHRIIDGEGMKIGYIKINQFGSETDQEFKNSIDLVKQEFLLGDRNLKYSIIIDLRNNPGGLLNIVAKMVNRFVTQGVIVSTKDREKEVEKYEANRHVSFPKYFPLAVLINEHSASASEIMSGALKDYGRAVLIGRNSYGKFSVQKFFDIEPGKSSVKLTIAKYYLPSGNSFGKKGITPHVIVSQTRSNQLLQVFYQSKMHWGTGDELVQNDPILKKAISVLKNEYKKLLK